jgi:hypothetical protein
MKKDSPLAPQLLWYGAAAGVTLAVAPAADAQVIYTDINPDVTLNAVPPEENETYEVDFDGDGDPELVMTEEALNNGQPSDYVAGFPDGATGGGPDTQVAVVADTSAGYQYFIPLSAGQSISAGNVSATAAIPYGPTFTFQGGDPNGWTGAGEQYAGVQFQLDSGDTHYGWILLEIPETGTVIVKEFAYESTPDTAIQAGDRGTVAIEPNPDGTPGTHALTDARPNPFDGRTQFTLEVAEAQHVTVAVYNALGQHVATLHDGLLAAGTEHRFGFDAAGLAAGVYVVRATGERFTDVRTVTLAR